MAVTATSTQSIDLVHQFMDDVIVDRKYDRIADLDEDFVQHDIVRGMDVHGHDEFEAMRRIFDEAFSDTRRTNVLSFASEGGDYVCSVDTLQATHDGEFMGIGPTEDAVEIQAVTMYRIKNEQITEMWNLGNWLGLLQQIGAVPPIEGLAA